MSEKLYRIAPGRDYVGNLYKPASSVENPNEINAMARWYAICLIVFGSLKIVKGNGDDGTASNGISHSTLLVVLLAGCGGGSGLESSGDESGTPPLTAATLGEQAVMSTNGRIPCAGALCGRRLVEWRATGADMQGVSHSGAGRAKHGWPQSPRLFRCTALRPSRASTIRRRCEMLNSSGRHGRWMRGWRSRAGFCRATE